MRLSKKIIALMAVCTLGLAGSHLLHSETVGQKEAKSMAQKFFNESKGYVTPPVEYVYNGRISQHSDFLLPSMYSIPPQGAS